MGILDADPVPAQLITTSTSFQQGPQSRLTRLSSFLTESINFPQPALVDTSPARLIVNQALSTTDHSA